MSETLLLVMLAWSLRRKGRVPQSRTPGRALRYAVTVLAISVAATILSAHAAGAEFGRILLVPGVAARLAIVIAVAALIELLVERFSGESRKVGPATVSAEAGSPAGPQTAQSTSACALAR